MSFRTSAPASSAAVGMGADGSGPRVLLRLAFPLDRGLEKRPAAGSGRVDRRGECSLRVEPQDQGKSTGRECRFGGVVASDVRALSGTGAGLGRTVLWGRTLLSLLRPAPDSTKRGCPARAGGGGTHRRLGPRCESTVAILLFAAAPRLAGSPHSGSGRRDPPRAGDRTVHLGFLPRG